MDDRSVWFGWVAHAIEIAGVAAIVVGIVLATARFGRDVAGRRSEPYTKYRRALGRTLLLGLELLVAADIVSTVAVEPTFTGLGVLGLLVVVRTFLSWALEVEIEGRWPWRSHVAESAKSARAPEVRDAAREAPGHAWPAPG